MLATVVGVLLLAAAVVVSGRRPAKEAPGNTGSKYISPDRLYGANSLIVVNQGTELVMGAELSIPIGAGMMEIGEPELTRAYPAVWIFRDITNDVDWLLAGVSNGMAYLQRKPPHKGPQSETEAARNQRRRENGLALEAGLQPLTPVDLSLTDKQLAGLFHIPTNSTVRRPTSVSHIER